MKLLKKLGVAAALVAASGSVMANVDQADLLLNGHVALDFEIGADTKTTVNLASKAAVLAGEVTFNNNSKNFSITVDPRNPRGFRHSVNGSYFAPYCVRIEFEGADDYEYTFTGNGDGDSLRCYGEGTENSRHEIVTHEFKLLAGKFPSSEIVAKVFVKGTTNNPAERLEGGYTQVFNLTFSND